MMFREQIEFNIKFAVNVIVPGERCDYVEEISKQIQARISDALHELTDRFDREVLNS